MTPEQKADELRAAIICVEEIPTCFKHEPIVRAAVGRLLDPPPADLIERAHREAWTRDRVAKEYQQWLIGGETP